MTIHITLLDLPPPETLKQYAPLGLLLIRPPPGNAIIGIDPGISAANHVAHLTTLPHRIYRIAYYGYALPLVVVATSEYEHNPYTRSVFVWSSVDRKFNPWLIMSGKFRYPKGLTMPRKASATPAPVATVPAPATATPAPAKSVTAPKAVKGPKAKTEPITVEETTPDGAPVADEPAKKEKPVKPPFPTEVPTRDEVLALEYVREFQPMDIEVLKRNVCPEYKKILADAITNGTKCTIQVQPTEEFLVAFAKANGLNRQRKWPHVNRLIPEFRDNFDSSCTHYVLTVDWAVSNAGHSSIALLLAWYPTNPDNVASWGFDFDVTSQIDESTGLIVDDSETGTVASEVSQSFIDYYKQSGDFRVTLVINAPRESLLKMDDMRLEATDADFISGIPQLGKIKEDWGIDDGPLVQITNGLYKRTAQPSTDAKTNEKKYGTLAKGGRLNASEAPIRVLTFLPMILSCYALLRSYDTAKRQIYFANDLQNEKSRLSLKDVMVALCVLNPVQRQRLADLLCKPSTYGTALAQRLMKPVDSVSWAKPSADWIVTSLVKAGIGGNVQQCVTELFDDSWHDLAFRADGWDRGEIDEDGVSRQDVLDAMTAEVAEITGNADLVKNMADKVRRQERAEKLASGDTSRKEHANKGKPRK